MTNEKIEELLKLAKEEAEKNPIPPRKFKSTEDGIILDPNKKFDREWYEYEDDEAFGL